MITKYLEGTRYFTTEEGGNYQLEYYITRYENNSYFTYGLEVLKKSISGSDEVTMEGERIDNISETELEVKNIIDRLLCYTVTPACLFEVIDEIIAMA